MKNRVNGDVPHQPEPIPGTPSAQALMADAVAGRESPPPLEAKTDGKRAVKPGDRRKATTEDVWALRVIDLNNSVMGLRQQNCEQAAMLAEKERIISQLQQVIAQQEREKFMRESIGLRTRFGYVAGQTVLQEDLATGEYFVTELEVKPDPVQQKTETLPEKKTK